MAVSISAPVAAFAVLGGAWLQGRLSRQAAAEADDRQSAKNHADLVRNAVAELLAALDIAAQAAFQLADPPLRSTGKRSTEGAARIITEIDAVALSELAVFARTSATNLLAKANEVSVLEHNLLTPEMRERTREVVQALSQPRAVVGSGPGPDEIYAFYSLHTQVAAAYQKWREQASLTAEAKNTRHWYQVK